MRKIVRKIYMNFEKEEKWLNEMAEKGFNLVDFSFARYVFEEGTPGEYIYRIELLDQIATYPQSKEYIQFVEESGIDCVATSGRWVFFRKKASEGKFELFTTLSTRMGHYKKVMMFVGILAAVNLLFAFLNMINSFIIGEYSVLDSVLGYISLLNVVVFIILSMLFVSYWKKYAI